MRRLTTMTLMLTLAMVLTVGLGGCKTDSPVAETPDMTPGLSDPSGPGDTPGGGSSPSGGGTPSGSYSDDMATAIAALPDSQAIAQVWDYLGGYWTNDDGLYFGFLLEGDDYYIEYGRWDSEGNGSGRLTNSLSTDVSQAILTIHFEAMPATEQFGARPEFDAYVMLDARDYAAHNQISILVADQGNGGWYKYAYSGKTFGEAYENVH